MADAKTEILRRIRTALADHPEPGDIPRAYDTSRTYRDLTGLAAERIADYRAQVWRVTPAELPARIAAALAERQVGAAVAPSDVPEHWRVAGVDWLTDDPQLTTAELDRADGVVTGCAVAIAETGTVVLDAGTAQGRRALTLVPDYHLCVVRADQIVATVPEALTRLDPVRPLTFISGPSATSDIELERVEGVHGPRTLDVVIVGG